MGMLASVSSSMLAASTTLYPDLATITRKLPVGDTAGGSTRGPPSALFTDIAVNVQQAASSTAGKSIIEAYGRDGIKIDHVIYTTVNVMSVRLNDIVTVGTASYIAKAPKDMGGQHRNFAIYAEIKS